jgi:nitrogen regulatory protein P-II 1
MKVTSRRAGHPVRPDGGWQAPEEAFLDPGATRRDTPGVHLHSGHFFEGALKLIQAVIPPESIHKVQDELNRVEVFRLTLSDVTAIVGDSSPGMTYGSSPAVRLEIAVNENFVRPTLDALYRALKDEEESMGIVYVLPLKDVIRIRTGERGPEAV